MSSLEITAVFFGIANMLLIIRRSVWNYPLALVMVSLYALIFWQTKLYSDAGLQVFFFVINLLGWATWYRHEAEDGEIIVSEMSPEDRTLWIIGSFAAVLAWGTVMHQLTDGSVPYLDAAVAMLSVAAQILMIRRKVESWHWWIVVNVISIGLYTYKHLYLTAGLYILLLILAVIGLKSWKKAARA